MWIKICGITNCDDAATVVNSQADAIGLNFYPKSKRYVPRETARLIADEIQRRVELVGVFVNAPLADIAQLVQEVGLTAVQFHGDEQPEDIQQFQQLCPGTPVIRAFRVGPETAGFVEQLQKYEDLSTPLNSVLADAWSADEYGGTGQTVNSHLLAGHSQLNSRLILAGGLTAENVSEAIHAVRPWGVDTASGVESSPGIKSAALVKNFVTACRNAIPHDPRHHLA
jgi:phosphoribosylanthranilate isomerase